MSNTQHHNPFKFLDSYTKEDRDVFFGRDNEIAQLYRVFYASRLTVIYGESGSGKTSLIQCGLQAEVSEDDALFIPVRLATDPLKLLRKKLLRKLEEIPDSYDLNHLLKELWYQEGLTLVLVLDQFEEFFLFHSPAEREYIIEQSIVWTQCDYIRVIISIREDYYARLTELETYLPEIFDNRFWVKPMIREQARDVIVQPCQLYSIEVEEKLVDKLLDDLLAGNKEIDLPILQVVLDKLYQQATEDNTNQLIFSLQAYLQLGEVDKILANFIDSTLAQYDDVKAISYVLKAMITEQGTRKVSKLEQIKQEFPNGLEINESELEFIMQRLSSSRLVRNNVGEETYELRHDSLAKAFVMWERNRVNLKDNSADHFKGIEIPKKDLNSQLIEHQHSSIMYKIRLIWRYNKEWVNLIVGGLFIIAGLSGVYVMVILERDTFHEQREKRKSLTTHNRNIEGQDKLELGNVYQELGNVYKNSGEYDKSLKAFQGALRTYQVLAKKDPLNPESQQNLSKVFSKLGDIAIENKLLKDALSWYLKALETTEKITSNNVGTIQHSLDLAELHYKISRLTPEKSNQHVQKAEAILYKINKRGELSKANQQYFQEMKVKLGIE